MMERRWQNILNDNEPYYLSVGGERFALSDDLKNRNNIDRFPDGRPVTLQEIRLVPSASNCLRVGQAAS